MDAWCEKHTQNKYDRNAQWAKQGQTNAALLSQLMSDPYLAKCPPKSTGREHYNLEWLEKQITQKQSTQQLRAEDVQRTLCEFTAQSITQQIHDFKIGPNCELLVCGGGANNSLLMELLQQKAPDWNVLPTSDRGIPGDYLEAMAFAWFARQKVHNRPSNIPSVTGARCKASLGVVYKAVKEFR